MAELHGVPALSGGLTGRSLDRLIAFVRALTAPPLSTAGSAGGSPFGDNPIVQQSRAKVAR